MSHCVQLHLFLLSQTVLSSITTSREEKALIESSAIGKTLCSQSVYSPFSSSQLAATRCTLTQQETEFSFLSLSLSLSLPLLFLSPRPHRYLHNARDTISTAPIGIVYLGSNLRYFSRSRRMVCSCERKVDEGS